MNKKITIYTSKTCTYCDQVKDKLKESSIKFTEIDIIEYKDGFEQFRTKKYEYMHSSKYFHYEIDKLLSLIENAITNNVCDISRLYTEISLLDETRNQSYKDFLDSSLINILESYEREINR